MMNEALLQFIWQNKLFTVTALETTGNEPLAIIHPGKLNRNSGPDFLEARVRIGNTLLIGNIELHINSSDWMKHKHDTDAAYNNLVLHAVYNDDQPAAAGSTPVLELKKLISQDIIARYSAITLSPGKLPCAGLHNGVKYITKESWMSTLLAERWEQKLEEWNLVLQHNAEDWRNLLYWRMAANFGFKVNAAPFLMLAQSLPLNLIAKHRENSLQIEALLFGQAGMLNGDFTDEYPRQLQKEYDYLKKKYQLTPIAGHLWKFLRMRPANFPTIRIAQFAALLQQSVHLFSKVIETHTTRDIEPLLDVRATEYWDNHYRFDELQKRSYPKSLGITSIQNIIINTVAPIQFLYAAKQGNMAQHDAALALLETVAPEQNSIVTLFENSGWHASNAAQTQALIQLYNNYCTGKRCLECAVGHSIIKSNLPIENH